MEETLPNNLLKIIESGELKRLLYEFIKWKRKK